MSNLSEWENGSGMTTGSNMCRVEGLGDWEPLEQNGRKGKSYALGSWLYLFVTKKKNRINKKQEKEKKICSERLQTKVARRPDKKLETLWAIRPPRTNCCRSNTSGTGQA